MHCLGDVDTSDSICRFGTRACHVLSLYLDVYCYAYAYAYAI